MRGLEIIVCYNYSLYFWKRVFSKTIAMLRISMAFWILQWFWITLRCKSQTFGAFRVHLPHRGNSMRAAFTQDKGTACRHARARGWTKSILESLRDSPLFGVALGLLTRKYQSRQTRKDRVINVNYDYCCWPPWPQWKRMYTGLLWNDTGTWISTGWWSYSGANLKELFSLGGIFNSK